MKKKKKKKKKKIKKKKKKKKNNQKYVRKLVFTSEKNCYLFYLNSINGSLEVKKEKKSI